VTDQLALEPSPVGSAPAPVAGRRAGQVARRHRLALLDNDQADSRAEAHRVFVAVAYVLALVAGSGVELLRQPGTPAWDTIWAEAGSIFYAQAKALPFWETFTKPYAGYMHAVPRIIAEVAVALPLRDAAAALAIAAAATVSALALIVFRLSADVVERKALRVALAATVLLLPAGGTETLNSVADLHWYLDYTAFWLILFRPKTWAGSALTAAGLALAVMSDPLVVLLTPMLVVQTVTARAWRERFVLVGFVTGGVFQLVAALSTPRGPTNQHTGLLHLLGQYSQRVLLSVFTGFRGERVLFGGDRWFLVVLAWLLVAGLLASTFVRDVRGRRVAVAALVSSLLFYLFPLWYDAHATAATNTLTALLWSRYIVAPTLLLASAVIISLDRGAPLRGRARPPSLKVWVPVLCVLAAVWLVDFRVVPNLRGQTVTWARQLSLAQQQCARAGTRSVAIKVAPGMPMKLSCSDVDPEPNSDRRRLGTPQFLATTRSNSSHQPYLAGISFMATKL
jgi:hypothetical protein